MAGQRGSQADGVPGRRGDAGEGSSALAKQQADLSEWRSRGQLEPMAPSTAPGYWSEDDDGGPKPADLYGKFTWKIENFSEISKRELRSNVFEVGGYKWYILVYPQGCDVCNHLSLFLCVADYDKLLPGWSHFAQFTIAVVNKDPKKSKYSDTLHRFCKKEHDWGWKKFMELSKVLDGFTVADTLVIKAQVQVIRENPGRPFRCLDCQYRRELVRVYLTNVEGICRRFVEEKRDKLSKIMDDSMRWASFQVFWSAVDETSRKRLAQEKADVILKSVVKRFFNEKEVTSTLVMDALYSGCKALDKSLHRSSLENRSSGSRAAALAFEDESSSPLVWIEKDTFVLGGDVLVVLERAINEPIPAYKDDKGGGTPNRIKEGLSGEEFGKDSVEGDERRLAELGRRTIEMFVLSHVFSNRVEVAYREAIALKRQEELIREEEEAEHAETERKNQRELAEKERKAKKKQAKQRKKERKAEERKVKEEEEDRQRREKELKLLKAAVASSVGDLDDEEEDFDDEDDEEYEAEEEDVVGVSEPVIEKATTATDEEGILQVADSKLTGVSQASKRRSRKQRAKAKKELQLDDSSSSGSSDSGLSGDVPEVVGSKSKNFAPSRRGIAALDVGLVAVAQEAADAVEARALAASSGAQAGEAASSSGHGDPEEADTQEAVIASLQERVSWLERRLEEKEEEVQVLQQQLQLLIPSSNTSDAKEVQSTGQPTDPAPGQLSRPSSSASDVSASDKSTRTGVAVTPKVNPRAANGPLPNTRNPAKASTAESVKGAVRGEGEGSNGPVSRPASAPITGPQVAQTNRPAGPPHVQYSGAATPALARSLSTSAATARDSPQSSNSGPPVVPSYRNAAAGRMRPGQAQPASVPGGAPPAAFSQATLARVSTGADATDLQSQPTSPSPPMTPPPRARTASPSVAPSTSVVAPHHGAEQRANGTQASEAQAAAQELAQSQGAVLPTPPQQAQQKMQNGITFGTVTGDVLPHAKEVRQQHPHTMPPQQMPRGPPRPMLHPGLHPALPLVDSPGLSEDFPHLSLINDLLDDSDFLGGFEGMHPGMPHPSLLRKLHPALLQQQAGVQNQQRPGVPQPNRTPQQQQGVVPNHKGGPPGPGEYHPDHGMRRQEPAPQLRSTRSLPPGVVDGILSNGHGPPLAHYWVPAGPGYTQGMHNGPMMDKAGNGGPAYVIAHPHPGFMPYTAPPPQQQQQQ